MPPDVPPSYGEVIPNNDEIRLEKLRQVAKKHDISGQVIRRLRSLEDFEIVLLCDDSTSMSCFLSNHFDDPFAKRKTRWQELSDIVQILTEVAVALDSNGVDLFFMNRASVKHVSASPQIVGAFQRQPQGETPTAKVLYDITRSYSAEKPVLVILAADGKPDDIEGFHRWVKQKPKNWYLSIVACTDDIQDIVNLRKLDRSYAGVCTVDDYASETRMVRENLGSNYPFSFGDYIVKILLGALNLNGIDSQPLNGIDSQPLNGIDSSNGQPSFLDIKKTRTRKKECQIQ
jgi:hypothetical protein